MVRLALQLNENVRRNFPKSNENGGPPMFRLILPFSGGQGAD